MDGFLNSTKDDRKDDRDDDEDDDREDKSDDAVCDVIGNSGFGWNFRNAAKDESSDEWVSEREERWNLCRKNLILIAGDDESNIRAVMRHVHQACAFFPS